MKKYTAIFFFALLILSCGKTKKEQESVTLFAAASTIDFVTSLSAIFEKQTGIKVIINAASSGTLARQIETGADVDLFLSASEKWTDYLIENNITTNDKIITPMQNSLVMIVPKFDTTTNFCTSPFDLPKHLDESRLAIGDPAHVPAGKYGVDALTFLGVYDSIKTRVLPTQNVRAALSAVEMGECDYGIVYLTDAIKSNKVKVQYSFPDSTHKPIKYSMVLLSENENAKKLFTFVQSAKADSLIEQLGFSKP